MAEITTEQVKTLLESFAALCGSNSKAKELCGDAIKFVEQQAQEIAKLKEQLRCEHSAFLQAKAFAESLAQKLSPWAMCKECKFYRKECETPIKGGCELWLEKEAEESK